MALFVKLDTNWVNHPKIIRAGIDGAGAHAVAMCLAKQMETDGWVSRLLLARYGVTAELCERLVDLRLLEVGDDDEVRPWGWHDRNPSQGAIDARRDAKREAGMRGNHARYKHAGEFADCRICHGNGRSSQVAIADARTLSQSLADGLAPPSPESETESDPEPESEPAYIGSTTSVAGEPCASDASLLGFAAPKPAALDEVRAKLKGVPGGGTHADRTGAGQVVVCADGGAVTA